LSGDRVGGDLNGSAEAAEVSLDLVSVPARVLQAVDERDRLIEHLVAVHDVEGELQVEDLRVVSKTDAVERRTCIDDLRGGDGHARPERKLIHSELEVDDVVGIARESGFRESEHVPTKPAKQHVAALVAVDQVVAVRAQDPIVAEFAFDLGVLSLHAPECGVVSACARHCDHVS